ncbi:hybrid sensor histidine kinase/response regulator [Haloarcula pelagica]|uniref:hybrid sensor histidine kinase/response regulator n=1 Tax=Haloarcula pelagica TaxID=3033389 RepID=UPI0024C37FC5|nr:hybrid sensor histidine kinase/response regulator [Halomicroarcula sp. YJ-61-S]
MSEIVHDLDVLVVEDNPGDATLLRKRFERQFGSREASLTLLHEETLDAGIEQARTAGIDIVLLDLGLERTTGLATLEAFLDAVDSVPVIVLTGLDDEELALAAIREGAQDYLVKGDLTDALLTRTIRYARERHEQEQELQRRTEQMEFFNSILRHDILNGMNVIRSRADLLEGDLDGQQAEYAETIVDWSDDIIDLTRKVRSVLDTLSGESLAELEAVELGPTLEAAADRARSMAEGCTVTVEDTADTTVVADELLEDVFGNVLTNAVEHGGPAPTIDISVTVDDQRVTIRAADDGPGIDPADRRSVFERGATGAESSGTGFGLYFVDAMIESYGGEVWIEESDAGGTAVVADLQRASGHWPPEG